MAAPVTRSHAYLVGGGIASLAAAVFLIRDAGFSGEHVHILEELPVPGGALDAGGDPERGYVLRGGRMLEDEAYVCLWDLLGSIPTLTGEGTVLEEVHAFNAAFPTEARARLVGRGGRIRDAADLGLSGRDRLELARLVAMPETVIGARRIDELFSPHFLATPFWTMWRTTFAFQNWHSAIELKRYLLRFLQELPRIHTLRGVRRTRLNQYDSIVRPVRRWLTDRGVRIAYGVRVTDLDFAFHGGRRRVERIRFRHDSMPGAFRLEPGDLAFVTLGSMTADTSLGGDHTVPELIRDKRDGCWRLWETIARRAPDFGRPEVFDGAVDASKWESFTLTMRGPALLEWIEHFSGNAPGTGALMTFEDSGWLMSLVVPHQPHFAGQPADVRTAWGYGLRIDAEGDFVPKPMSGATGQEILTELLGQLGHPGPSDEIRSTTTVTTALMPYITSQFAPRAVGDRPAVIPRGAVNFAFLGQFTEIPREVVFTVEYSVRGAMRAVYGLLGVDREIPPVRLALERPEEAVPALRAALG